MNHIDWVGESSLNEKKECEYETSTAVTMWIPSADQVPKMDFNINLVWPKTDSL